MYICLYLGIQENAFQKADPAKSAITNFKGFTDGSGTVLQSFVTTLCISICLYALNDVRCMILR